MESGKYLVLPPWKIARFMKSFTINDAILRQGVVVKSSVFIKVKRMDVYFPNIGGTIYVCGYSGARNVPKKVCIERGYCQGHVREDPEPRVVNLKSNK